MAQVVHISEEEAARDFEAVLQRARAAESVVVVWRDGSETLVQHNKVPLAAERQTVVRTVAEAREILRVRKKAQGLAVPDADFAADMEAIHAVCNEPMDMSRWD